MPSDPSDAYSPAPSAIERRAAGLLRHYAGLGASDEGQGSARRARLRQVTRRAVLLAIAAGIVSGGLIGGSEVWMRQSLGLEDMDFWDALPWWIGWFAVAGVVSAIEIAFLYWVAIRGIGRVVATAGVALGPEGYAGLMARGLARGALEFPNPRDTIWGVDPYAYVPRWRLVLRSVAYKLKVGVSSFILRVFLRRVATRLAIRGIVPLMAGPLYAAWNAIIIWRIMTEARIRAFGPTAIDSMLEAMKATLRPGTPAAEVVLHGVGEIVRRAADMHPNHVHLLSRLREELDVGDAEIEVDWPQQEDRLAGLEAEEKDRALRLLTLATVVGSRTTRRQRHMLRSAFETAGRAHAEAALKALRRDLKDGRLAVPEGLGQAMADADRRAA